jgi:hypothetical protein
VPRCVLTSRPGFAATLLLAAAALVLGMPAAPSHAADASCAADEVTVAIDFNELGGGTQRACVPGGGTATRIFHAAGFATTEAPAPGLQGFICRVAGKPATGPCTRGDAYWSLWWSEPGDEATWVYASLGANQLELVPGSYVGFAWHQGEGAATPPDLGTAVAPPTGAGSGETATPQDDGGRRWLFLLGGAAVLGAAAIVPIRRARA